MTCAPKLFEPRVQRFHTPITAAVTLAQAFSTREFGGARSAQVVTATASGIGGATLTHGSFYSCTSFDRLSWILTAYFVIRLLKWEDPRWWLGWAGHEKMLTGRIRRMARAALRIFSSPARVRCQKFRRVAGGLKLGIGGVTPMTTLRRIHLGMANQAVGHPGQQIAGD